MREDSTNWTPCPKLDGQNPIRSESSKMKFPAIIAAVILIATSAHTKTPDRSLEILKTMIEPPQQSAFEQGDLASSCCKTCRKGKPCGDSCVARDARCTKPPGCACAANE